MGRQLHNGRGAKHHCITTSKRNRSHAQILQPIARLCRNAPRCRPKIHGERHDFGRSLRRLLFVRSKSTEPIGRTLLSNERQRRRISKRRRPNPFIYYQAHHGVRLRFASSFKSKPHRRRLPRVPIQRNQYALPRVRSKKEQGALPRVRSQPHLPGLPYHA